MTILAIDPGTTESGYCMLHGRDVMDCGVLPNEQMLDAVKCWVKPDSLAVEMVASYGMPVGREVFETCVWIGRFVQAWRDPDAVRLIYRKDVKMHLCGSARAKDANVRQALIDLFGGSDAIGKKANPGPLYRVKSHAWPALAVAVTSTAG